MLFRPYLFSLIAFLPMLCMLSCTRSQEDKFRACIENQLVEEGQSVEIISIQLMDSVYFRNARWMKNKQAELMASYEKLLADHNMLKKELGDEVLVVAEVLDKGDQELKKMESKIQDFYGESLTEVTESVEEFGGAYMEMPQVAHSLKSNQNSRIWALINSAQKIENEMHDFGYSAPYNVIAAMSDSGLPGYMSNRLWETTTWAAYSVIFKTEDGEEKEASIVWQRKVEKAMNPGILP